MVMGEGLDLPEDLQNTPIRALGPASRRLLSWYLDPPVEVLTSDGLSRDVTGLADLAGFDSIFIRYLETKQNKTGTFLEAWGTRNNATLGNLDSFLKKIERFDCISDTRETILNDIEKWRGKQNVTTQGLTTYKAKISSLTKDEIPTEILQKYSACICCADDDLDLANLIVDKYADDGSNFQFFIPQEDLTGGQYEFEATADVIENRCGGRIIVILSESYLSSPACVFATQFTKTLDPDAKGRKIIPIVKDEKVVYPRVLRGITTIKTSRLKHGDSFWRRLTSSLSVFPHHTVCSGHESNETEQDHRRENTSFIDKNIIDLGDISNLSRDSVSLRSDSFDSSSEFGECEKVDNVNNRTVSRTHKSSLLLTESKSRCEEKPLKLYRTGSVPDILESGKMGNQSTLCSSTENLRVNASSSFCSLVNAEEKPGTRKKISKSPKDWLLRKFFNTFHVSNTSKNKRMTSSSVVCRADESYSKSKQVDKLQTSYTEPCIRSVDRQSSISDKSVLDSINQSGLISTSEQQCSKLKERPVTFSLESQSSFDETSSSQGSKDENSVHKSSDVTVFESTTSSVTQRTVFTMDI